MAREKGRKQKNRCQVFLKILFWALDLKRNPLEGQQSNGKSWSFGPTGKLGRFSASLSLAGVFYLSSRWVVETDFSSGRFTHRSKNAWMQFFLTLLCWFCISRRTNPVFCTVLARCQSHCIKSAKVFWWKQLNLFVLHLKAMIWICY